MRELIHPFYITSFNSTENLKYQLDIFFFGHDGVYSSLPNRAL
jgi:hypothetical protein